MIVIVMIVIFSFQVKRIYDKKGGNYKQINLNDVKLIKGI